MPSTLFTIDTHTGGEPTRILIGGLPHIPGESMQAKRRELQTRLDWVRRSLIWEPRGHRDMFGAVITPPVTPGCAFGVVFMDSGGYLNMCGHGSIGVLSAAHYLGWIAPDKLREPLRIDTPAGVIDAWFRTGESGAMEVGITNVPAYVAEPSVLLDLAGGRQVEASIVFGGSFFALVNAAALGFRLVPAELPALVALGREILARANQRVQVSHPLTPEIASVDLVEFWLPGEGVREGRNVVVFGDGQVDRSPCGTGTCAKLAYLHQTGKLAVHQPYRQYGILGTSFEGVIVEETRVGPYPAIRPTIYGSAHVTGTHQFIVDPGDPLARGFLLAQ